MNLPVTPATNYRMTNATGPSFQIKGKTSFILRRKKRFAKIDALVVEGLNHPLLISWNDCVHLKLITRKFPLDDDDYSKSTSSDSNMVNISQISSFKKSSHSGIKHMLLNEFDDVIHDFLNPLQMKSPPMHIHLSDRKEKPLRISTARQIPKHLLAVAKAEVQNLLQKGVIQRIDTPTTRCSPAFFVPKADGGVHMVTDFTDLNKSIDRPVHPFPSSAEIMQLIPPDANFFQNLMQLTGTFNYLSTKNLLNSPPSYYQKDVSDIYELLWAYQPARMNGVKNLTFLSKVHPSAKRLLTIFLSRANPLKNFTQIAKLC